MLLNSISPKFVTFTSANPNKDKNREKVGEAAAATGVAGAGYSATRSAAFKAFNSSKKLADGAQALGQPIKQTNSIWNALRLNYRNLTNSIKTWAQESKMIPKFAKPLFTGVVGKFIGGVAAVFVFINGVSEVIDTVANSANKMSQPKFEAKNNYSQAA